MKPLRVASIPQLRTRFQAWFPRAVVQTLWHKAQPHAYEHKVEGPALVWAFVLAFVLRVPSLRALEGAACVNGVRHHTLACALQRDSSGAFVEGLVGHLEDGYTPVRGGLEAVDGMALTLPKTRRHRCKKFNNHAVGGGVVWSVQLDKPHGAATSPVKVLAVVEGAWHDGTKMRRVALIPYGPVYLMDRGFYTLDLLERWVTGHVHFIARARAKTLHFEVLDEYEAPGRVGNVRVVRDAKVRLGAASAKHRPVVRLVQAVLAGGEELTLVTDRYEWTLEKVLDSYKRRQEIEQFHRFLKDALGLAHLYSFAWAGMRFLLHVALLLALLLLGLSGQKRGRVVALLHQALKRLRQACGLGTPWKRNIVTPTRKRKKKRKPQAEAVETLELQPQNL